MKVILLADIRGVGRKNELKEVSPGYANNFLFPKKLAVAATPQALKTYESMNEKRVQEETKLLKHLKELAQKITDRSLVFPVKTNEEGTIFGSITKEIILSALRGEHLITKEHVDVDLDHPLKTVGDHWVEVDLKKGVTAKLKVTLKPAKE